MQTSGVGETDQRIILYLNNCNPITRRFITRSLDIPRRWKVSPLLSLPSSLPQSSEGAVVIVHWDKERLDWPGLAATVRYFGADSRKLVLGALVPDDICQCLTLGIRGAIHYNDIRRSLTRAVIAVMSGRLFVSRRVLERYILSSQHSAAMARNWQGLTIRQQQILECLRHGKTNKEIAVALSISENTVKFHLRRLFDKSGIHDRDRIDCVLTSMARQAPRAHDA